MKLLRWGDRRSVQKSIQAVKCFPTVLVVFAKGGKKEAFLSRPQGAARTLFRAMAWKHLIRRVT